MGRRPNQLVLEFFQRGQKLPDASNRYEHTCKRCGEVFPKGRVDNLMGHLLRRCPNVTQQDRETVFLYMQTNPSKPANNRNGKQNGTAINSLPVSAPPPQPQQGLPTDMRMHPGMPPPMFQQQQQPQQQQQSALGMLAEVSRRHLDYSSHRGGHYAGEQEEMMDEEGRALAEQALLLQFQEAAGGPLHPYTTSAESPGLCMYATPAPLLEQQKYEVHPPPTTETSPAPLVDTAVQANLQVEQAKPNHVELQRPRSEPIDPQLGIPIASATPHFDAIVSQANMHTNFMMWHPANPTGRQSFGTLTAPPNEPPPGFMLQADSKRPARGRFSDTRRKEVQEIRKRGACIRCRMLKKPCSEGTPCNTCANVESARLWKGTCIRTRLADEFTLWSTGLFHAKARSEVPAAVQGLHQFALPGRMEVRFFGSIDLCMSFAAKQYSTSPDAQQRLDPADIGEATCIWLLDEGDNMCDKIDEYVNRVAYARVSDERSPFLKATLEQALDLLQEEQANPTPEAQSGRSCYNLQSQLLKNIAELWVETSIITSPDELDLELRYNADKAPQHQPDLVRQSASKESSVATTIARTSHSYNLIKSQLLAATESRCSKLAKTIINELERRLLQRQQVSRFATFISAVILLACVERMTGFYRAFDSDNSSFAPTTHFQQWPLADTDHKLWPEGPHFAELLIMLLRMRGLPPKTQRRHDGTLAAIQDYSLPVSVQGKPVREQIDEQIKAAAAWLDPLKLSVHDLAVRGSREVPGREDGIEAWDMRFLGKVLLPEGMVK